MRVGLGFDRDVHLIGCAAAVLAFALSACGNKPAENQKPAAKQTHDTRPVIVAFGDSLTAGMPGESYPDFLQRLLDDHGYRYRVVNEGVSGSTTSDGLMRIDDVIARGPELVILELGGNDGLRGVPVPAIRANMEKLIQPLLDRHLTVLLAGMTLPPNYGEAYVKSFTRMYADLAAHYKLPLLPFLLQGVALEPGLMKEDGIHPTPQGNKRVAENVFHALEPLLKK